MTDAHTETEAPKPKRKTAKRARPIRKALAEPKASPFAGITPIECCNACTPDRCVISTVGICKHPMKTGDGGCGPITMANRKEALKILKIARIEAA